MKQNKYREEFNQKIFGIIVDYVHDDLFNKDTCVKSIDELYDWIETHTKKKVEDKIERVKGLKVGEAEGWDFFFGSKKQCCPGDDYSDIYNQAISDVLKIMEEK